jgi:predicted small secreted protein
LRQNHRKHPTAAADHRPRFCGSPLRPIDASARLAGSIFEGRLRPRPGLRAGRLNNRRAHGHSGRAAHDPSATVHAPAGTFYLLRTLKTALATSEEGTQMAKALTRTPAELVLLSGLTALLMMLVLSGCNTVEGMGEDVSAAGGAMSDTADDVKDEM